MEPMVKTLPVEVMYNNAYRKCANGGITEQVEVLYLVREDGWFSLPATDPRLITLVKRTFAGGREYLHVEPVNVDGGEDMAGPMFGGNFVYTSDSRFPSPYPIPVHDRFETWEQYKLLSN